MNPEYPDSSSNGARLQHIESLSMSPELFEKLYLSPENKVKGELRGTFGNPTPVYVSSFLLVVRSDEKLEERADLEIGHW